MDTVEHSVGDHHPRPDAGPGRPSYLKNADGESIKSVSDIEKQSVAPASDSQTTPDPTEIPPLKSLSFLDRFLVIWIVLAMAIGIILGNTVPSTGPALQRGTFVGVSIPIAVGLLVMMYPILCKVRYETLHLLLVQRALWVQMGVSFVLNWIVCPLLMTGLAWAFLPDREDLREGLIFVGIARCIAMVLIWTDLAKGDGDYCAVLVAFNSILQIVLFAPMALFYIRVVSHDRDPDDRVVNYARVSKSVAVFLGSHVAHQITSVLRICPPLIVYFFLVFGATVWLCRRLGFGYRVSCTQSFTAASNNFELAIAVCVGTYGAASGQALAATVGPLVEVPVLVALVYVLKWVRGRWGWKG
ncbi:arsenical-resistance protein ACR3 [Saccharata proteae CBS 121410]|uniref:Arsenical-resistance protein ACR3 n=1 Tax=Saccharata proteae CBS 121410 TaxID=1314787 RepID=A0A9P4I168_9PEZI|nr:arsenical-resistance protein ACR3 [Saccharata proteae CBS 121410]